MKREYKSKRQDLTGVRKSVMESERMRTSVILLCGGKSRRMGEDKAGLEFQGKTFLRCLMDTLGQNFDILLAVGEYAPGKVRDCEEYTNEKQVNIRQVYDRFAGCGPLAGIHAGMKAGDAEVFWVVPCDMPLVDQAVYEALIRELESDSEADVVIPVEGNGDRHVLCGLYRKRILQKLEKTLQEGNCRVQEFLKQVKVRQADVSGIPGMRGKLKNINTRKEYEAMKNRNIHGVPVISVAAYSGTGKTTFLEKLIALLKEQKIRVAAVKHDGHDFEVDKEGKDSWRFTRAGADITALISSRKAVLMENRPVDISAFLNQIKDVDLILAEGFKEESWPKILLYRETSGTAMAADPGECMAVISDVHITDSVPEFGFDNVKEAADFILTKIREQ